MTSPCLHPDDLPGAFALPAGDPRHQHLQDCPRCRALVHAYDEFMAGDQEGALTSDQIAAEAELGRRLARHLDTAVARRHRVIRSDRAWLAAAAVLLVCAGLFLSRDLVRLPGGEGQLRGEADPAGIRWQQASDGWRLTWDASPSSGRPVVLCFDDAMRPLASLAAAPGKLTPGALPAGAWYLQLAHVVEADTVARGPIVAARPGVR